MTMVLCGLLVTTPAQARFGFGFGQQDFLQSFEETDFLDEEGNALFLAYRTSTMHFFVPLWWWEDGYVLAEGGHSNYYPLSDKQIVQYQRAGRLPVPLPPFEAPWWQIAYGFSGWGFLLIAAGYATIATFWVPRWRGRSASAATVQEEGALAKPVPIVSPPAPNPSPAGDNGAITDPPYEPNTTTTPVIPSPSVSRLHSLDETSPALHNLKQKLQPLSAQPITLKHRPDAPPSGVSVPLSRNKRLGFIALSVILPAVLAPMSQFMGQPNGTFYLICIGVMSLGGFVADIALLASFRGEYDMVFGADRLTFWRLGINGTSKIEVHWTDCDPQLYRLYNNTFIRARYTETSPGRLPRTKTGTLPLANFYELSMREIIIRIGEHTGRPLAEARP